MANEEQTANDVDRFVMEYIDTVPHLEALLLIWSGRDKPWTVDYMSERLFLPHPSVKQILNDLVSRGLIVTGPAPDVYRYEGTPEEDRLLGLVDATYRRELVRVSRLIHSKAPAAVRAFARAFRVRKGAE